LKKLSIVSIFTTVVIWIAGFYAFFYLKETIPKQLSAKSSLFLEGYEKTSNEGNNESSEIKEIIHKVQKLVVKIEHPNGSFGSGFLYNNKGDIVTNAHVVGNAKEVTIVTADSKGFDGKVIGISSDTDVALIRVPGLANTEPLEIVTDRKAEVGDEILALGSPLGFQNTVTTGIISGVDRDLDIDSYHYEDVYQISAPIAPGNSGGPLIDSQTGEVLGINSARIEQESIGFSIPINSIHMLLQEWSANPMSDIPDIEHSAFGGKEEQALTDMQVGEYLVNYFYESLSYRDFVTAYSLLGSSWQTNTSYETFRKGYLHTTSVSVDEITSKSENDEIVVTAIITADEIDNGTKTLSKYKVTYHVGYENDQLKLLSKEAMAIEY